MSEMGLSAKKHPDALTLTYWEKGFKKKSYDGVAYFSDSHPMGMDRKSSPIREQKKLSAASYAKARQAMMTVKGEHERTLNIVPDLLVVAPQNKQLQENCYLPI